MAIRNKENGKIMMDLFQKVTDSHHYIPFNSYNPSQTKRNTPFNSARRLCTIVDEETSIDEHMKELKKTLSKQGYPSKLIGTTIKEAKNSQKKPATTAKVTEETMQILTFVSTYSQRNPDIFTFIKESFTST